MENVKDRKGQFFTYFCVFCVFQDYDDLILFLPLNSIYAPLAYVFGEKGSFRFLLSIMSLQCQARVFRG
jgi:hypothetical protein